MLELNYDDFEHIWTGTEATDQAVSYIKRHETGKVSKRKPQKKSRQWILAKKERRRRQGIDTRPDTKYTGRKRGDRF